MEKNIKKKNKSSSFLWLTLVAVIALSLLLFCQFYFGDSITSETTFFDNTFINGINVSGLTKTQAENLISTQTLENKEQINLKLVCDGKEWAITGDELEVVANFSPTLTTVMEYGRDGNVFQKKQVENKVREEGLHVQIPFEDVYGGIEQKISEIASEVESSTQEQLITFSPDDQTMFSVNGDGHQRVVDRSELKKQLSLALSGEIDPIIEIPTQTILPDVDLQDFVESIVMRSRFETDFSKSTADRKSNIALALSKFNGMVVEPEQTISFNHTTGPRTQENGYKSAKIIVGGKYVSGMGGGVCQASTTLYNALLRADVEITQVHHHTLPATYVPLSFDAMVSEGYADLVFKNTLDTPIFIKAYTTTSSAIVEIYGQPFEDGQTIQTKAELVKIIPHGGDDIITDTQGEYEDKVLYKGEYYRLKYPLEGYESKGYIQYYKNGELTSEKEIRHDHYLPQNGIIVEGTFTLEEGMSLPANNVKYIPPQKVLSQHLDAAKARFKMQ